MVIWFVIIIIIIIIIIIVAVILFVKKRGQITSFDNQINYYENEQQTIHEQHSDEYLNIYSNIQNMSYEELDKIYNTIMDSVVIKKMALGALSDKPEFKEKLKIFDYSPIEGGPIYGCYTNGEALELQEAVTKRLDNLSTNKG